VAWVAVRQLRARPDVPVRFAAAAFAAAAVHAAVFAAVQRRFGARGACLFVGASLAALAALGGPRRAAALLVLGAAAALFAAIGDRAGRLVLPDSSLSAGVRVGMGIALFSWAISIALMAGVFTPAFLAILLAAAAAWGAAGIRPVAADLRSAGHRLAEEWNGATAAGVEIGFLLASTAIVRNLAPESGFDALTRYLPWVKLAAHFHSFPDLPGQFPFVLPQAGLAWAAAFSFDPVAQRGAMLAALAVCAAIAASRCRTPRANAAPDESPRANAVPDESPRQNAAPHESPGGIGFLVVLAVASCPLVLSAAHGLQPDAFGWIAVLLLGVVAVDAKAPGSSLFWFSCGALAALAWCAKYSTAGFVAPLLLYAFWRGRPAGFGRNAFRAAAFGGVGALLAGGPWFVHAFRESRNPFFPVLSSIFPSPLWRLRIDEAWRGGFAFEKGWRGALWWPIDMTIHTNRFAEGHAGSFGLALLLLLLLAAIALRSTDRTERVWLAAGVVGTLLLWTKTPLVRYWLPALWLALPAAARGAARIAARIGRRPAAIGLAAIAAFQTAYAAFPSKPDLEGRPWAVFTGKIGEDPYAASAPGVAALERLSTADPSWPRVWYTGLYAVGHADVVPLMAERWELAFHVPPHDTAALFRYIDSAGGRYWAVANDLKDRAEFDALGIPERYWRESSVVVRDGTATIYRMPGPSPVSTELPSRTR